MELPEHSLEQLRALMKLMEQHDFNELDLRNEGKRLHLLRSPRNGDTSTVVMPAMMPGAMPAAAPAVAAAAEGDAGPGEGIKVVTSPMVGTFYRAAGPDAAPFVEEGASVNEESVLCIIEAMKVMNEIKAECAGEVVKILVANGEAVEYGEPLFHVKTS